VAFSPRRGFCGSRAAYKRSLTLTSLCAPDARDINFLSVRQREHGSNLPLISLDSAGLPTENYVRYAKRRRSW